MPATEVFFNARQNLGSSEITDHRENRVIGNDKSVVKFQKVRAGERSNGLRIAVAGTVKRMLSVDEFAELPSGNYLRTIFGTGNFRQGAGLFLHHKRFRKNRVY